MSDFNLVDPKGWEYDLQSVSAPSSAWRRGAAQSAAAQVYSAYMGYFQLHNVPW